MLQIAICDNDQKNLKTMDKLISSIMEKYSVRYNVVAYESGEELMETTLLFHLIFMDVQFDGGRGIEIGKKICRKNRTTRIILQSDSDECSAETVNKSHAFAFLEKPVREEILEEQIKEFLELQENLQEMWMLFHHIRYIEQEENGEKEAMRRPVREIFYFTNCKKDKSVRVITERGSFVCAGILSKLEDKMKPFGFEVCSRGFLVNLDKVERIKRCSIQLCNGEELPLSQRRTNYFKERVNEFT